MRKSQQNFGKVDSFFLSFLVSKGLKFVFFFFAGNLIQPEAFSIDRKISSIEEMQNLLSIYTVEINKTNLTWMKGQGS